MIKNRNIKCILLATFVCALVMGLNIDTEAQRKSSRRTRRAAAAKKKALALVAERRKGAEDVAIQIKNVSKFVFVLGGIATGIEEIDKEVRAGKASRELAERNAGFKDNVIRSIAALRTGLVKLEVDFRAKPALKPYLVHIRGLTADSFKAEDFALAGQFNQSGKQLLLVLERLADVLVELP